MVVDSYTQQNNHLQEQVDAIQSRYVNYRLNAIQRIKDYENKINYLVALTDDEFTEFMLEHDPIWRARRDSIIKLLDANS